nr:MAG TPA: hypothetical protein [Inoviridae sp.]
MTNTHPPPTLYFLFTFSSHLHHFPLSKGNFFLSVKIM